MTNETVGDHQLWLAAEAIVVGKFGTSAVYRELQRVRDDTARKGQAYCEDVIAGKDARIARLDRELANRREATMSDVTVGKLWTFEQIQEAVKKVAHNVPPDMRTQAVTAFQAEQLMGMVRNDMRATLATQEAQIKQQDSDWLAMTKAIAAIADNEWTQADDGTLLEQFDPWQALRETGGTIATQAAHISELEAIVTDKGVEALIVENATQTALIEELERKVEKLESNARIWRAWGTGSYE